MNQGLARTMQGEAPLLLAGHGTFIGSALMHSSLPRRRESIQPIRMDVPLTPAWGRFCAGMIGGEPACLRAAR